MPREFFLVAFSVVFRGAALTAQQWPFVPPMMRPYISPFYRPMTPFMQPPMVPLASPYVPAWNPAPPLMHAKVWHGPPRNVREAAVNLRSQATTPWSDPTSSGQKQVLQSSSQHVRSLNHSRARTSKMSVGHLEKLLASRTKQLESTKRRIATAKGQIEKNRKTNEFLVGKVRENRGAYNALKLEQDEKEKGLQNYEAETKNLTLARDNSKEWRELKTCTKKLESTHISLKMLRAEAAKGASQPDAKQLQLEVVELRHKLEDGKIQKEKIINESVPLLRKLWLVNVSEFAVGDIQTKINEWEERTQALKMDLTESATKAAALEKENENMKQIQTQVQKKIEENGKNEGESAEAARWAQISAQMAQNAEFDKELQVTVEANAALEAQLNAKEMKLQKAKNAAEPQKAANEAMMKEIHMLEQELKNMHNVAPPDAMPQEQMGRETDELERDNAQLRAQLKRLKDSAARGQSQDSPPPPPQPMLPPGWTEWHEVPGFPKAK